jgi:FtsZ-binding cell division protein ZapB
MKKKESYKVKYEVTKAHEDILIEEIARLQAEVTELRWQNESLMIENKRLTKVNERYFEAGVPVARLAEKLKAENIKLKARLSVFSKKGELKDAI